jgi:hypothetical protein
LLLRWWLISSHHWWRCEFLRRRIIDFGWALTRSWSWRSEVWFTWATNFWWALRRSDINTRAWSRSLDLVIWWRSIRLRYRIHWLWLSSKSTRLSTGLHRISFLNRLRHHRLRWCSRSSWTNIWSGRSSSHILLGTRLRSLDLMLWFHGLSLHRIILTKTWIALHRVICLSGRGRLLRVKVHLLCSISISERMMHRIIQTTLGLSWLKLSGTSSRMTTSR